MNDSNGDGLCDELTVMGCTDAEACNYDDCANLDDGSCELPHPVLECDSLCPMPDHVYYEFIINTPTATECAALMARVDIALW